MRQVNAFVLLLIFIIIQSGTAVVAHPEAIKKKTVDLTTDTIIVAEKSIDGSSGYTITNITSVGTTGNASYSMYNMLNSKHKGTSTVLKVNISSVKYASDFNLKFSFKSGGCVGNCLRAYCISYKDGEELVETLAGENIATVTQKPNAITMSGQNLIYEYQYTAADYSVINAELSVKDSSVENPKKYSSVLEKHISDAIKNGQDSVYFLIACVTSTSYDNTNTDARILIYTPRSEEEQKPSASIEASTLFSEVIKTENGYTYNVENLKEYSQNAMLFIAAYDGEGNLIKVATSGEVTATESNGVDIECEEAASLKAYIWEGRALMPITYIETIALGEIE